MQHCTGHPADSKSSRKITSRTQKARFATVQCSRNRRRIRSVEAVSGRSLVAPQISVAGGRHAMGGQQFGSGTWHLDTSPLSRVLDLDSERGLVTIEAGIQWPQLVNHLLWAGADQPGQWGIIQKQTGADRFSIGGSLSANIHGRGLRLQPIIGDVEWFDLIDATGSLVTCSRTVNPELFSLAIGGYGLFGVIARVTLRLARRHKLERCVSIGDVEDLPGLLDQRIGDGFEYGDFQFATSPGSEEFLRSGVFSCYRPVADDRMIPSDQRELGADDWHRLLWLAHVDKARAFAEYARYYMSTDGQLYWSDTHQLSTYADHYHDAIDERPACRLVGPGSAAQRARATTAACTATRARGPTAWSSRRSRREHAVR